MRYFIIFYPGTTEAIYNGNMIHKLHPRTVFFTNVVFNTEEMNLMNKALKYNVCKPQTFHYQRINAKTLNSPVPFNETKTIISTSIIKWIISYKSHVNEDLKNHPKFKITSCRHILGLLTKYNTVQTSAIMSHDNNIFSKHWIYY